MKLFHVTFHLVNVNNCVKSFKNIDPLQGNLSMDRHNLDQV